MAVEFVTLGAGVVGDSVAVTETSVGIAVMTSVVTAKRPRCSTNAAAAASSSASTTPPAHQLASVYLEAVEEGSGSADTVILILGIRLDELGNDSIVRVVSEKPHRSGERVRDCYTSDGTALELSPLANHAGERLEIRHPEAIGQGPAPGQTCGSIRGRSTTGI